MNDKIVYLALGSNIGEREQHLEQALKALEEVEVRVVKRSSVYETEPQGMVQQPWFLNMVVEARIRAMPMQLLNRLLKIEQEIGRVRRAETAHGGPRPIDLDILLFSNAVIQLPQLTVPHPRMIERRFVLEPLLEIAPDLRHPVTGEALRSYLPATLSQQVRVKR